ncbi:MAG: GAF domain-containing protein [Deltaproteobacteria bacterium]|nr:GAF domain-containing protein [Deltaproteobacteria bacterium]
MLRNKHFISIPLDERKLKKRNRNLSMLIEMSNFLAGARDRGELLNGALCKMLEFFHMEGGRAYLMDDTGQILRLVAYQGIDPSGLEIMRLNEGFSGLAIRSKSFTAQYVSELKDEERAALLTEKGFRIVICVPLLIADKVVGVLNLATRHIIKLDQDKIDIMTAIGNQIAVAANRAEIFEDLKKKLEMLREQKEMIKLFAYSVSHDLKSPAIAVSGLTQRLKKMYGDQLDEKGRSYCDRIVKTAQGMGHLVEEINSFITAREVPLNVAAVNMVKLLEEIMVEFSTELKDRRIRCRIPAQLPVVMADRMLLTRIFRNLIDNALKYGGENLAEIRVEHDETHEDHIFSVIDDGAGIPETGAGDIFQVFKRLANVKGVSGSGLGLAIVKEIVERHGGRVWIDDRRKAGTTVCFSILKNLIPNT